MYGVVRVFLQKSTMSTLHATCASHTHAQTSCSKRVLCPPPRQLARVHHHTTLATESHRPKKKKAVVRTPCPKACVSSSRLLSPHAPRLPIHSCPPSLSHRSACTPLAPRKAQTQPSPQPAQHDDSTVHTTQNTTNSHSPRHPQHAIHDGNASIRAAVSSPCPPDSTATTALPLLPRSDGLPKSRESLNLSSYSLLSPHASGST